MGFFSDLRDKLIVQPAVTELQKAVLASVPAKPEVFDIPPGFNNYQANVSKRRQGGIDFATLRAMSVSHETVRAAINVRKRQISGLEYEIVDQTPGETNTEVLDACLAFVESLTDNQLGLSYLLDVAIEDLLTLDAVAWYKLRSNGGKLLKLIPIDASTIKVLVDETGQIPAAPEIAFEQWVAGKKVAEMTTHDLLYFLMNPRTLSPYGLSPLESLILSVDASLQAMLYNIGFLKDNNIPAGFISMPEGWTPDQIKQYKDFFDAWVQGATETNKIFMIPSGSTYQSATKPGDFSFKDFFDYLDRRVAMLFDVTPQELGLSLQQYKENAQGQDKIQMRKGIRPLALLFSRIFTNLLTQEFGATGVKFQFIGVDNRFDVDEIVKLTPLGVIGIDEARIDLRLPKVGMGPAIIQNGSVTPLAEAPDGVVSPTASGSGNTNNLPSQPTIPDEMVQKMALVSHVQAPLSPTSPPPATAKIDLNIKTRHLLEKGESLLEEPLAKADPKLTLDDVEGHKTFRQFTQMAKEAIIRQIEPFTDPDTIAAVTKVGKADIPPTSVGDYLDGIVIEGLEGFLSWAGNLGTQNGVKELHLDTSFDEKSPEFVKYLSDRSNYLIQSVDNTTKDWLVGLISEGKNQAMTNEEVAAEIADQMPSISSVRADMIARTEVANAMQQGELDVYRQQGVEKKSWQVFGDACEICEENDSQVVGVDETFNSGDDAPPAHPNCRCFIQAVFED